MKKFLCTLGVLCFALALHAEEKLYITLGPYLQQMTPTEVTICWKSERPATGWVEIAPDDRSHFYAQERPKYFQSLYGRKVIDTLHRVRVTGLTPGTTYRYRVVSEEVTNLEDYIVEYGPIASTEVSLKPHRFTTFDDTQETLSLTMVNDIHGDSARYRQLLSDPAKRGVDLVVLNGDMANHLSSERQMQDAFLTTTVEAFASDIPFFYSRGNHETRGRYSWRFLDYYPSPTCEPYYTFRAGPVFFVVLDGGEDKPDSDIEYYGLGDYDQFREKEARWLDEVVASEAFKAAPYRIVLMHMPPIQDNWRGAEEIRRLFVPRLNGHGIDLMLSGHTHREMLIPAGGESPCDFPVLVNDHQHALDLTVTPQEIQVKSRDVSQKITKTLEFPRKK